MPKKRSKNGEEFWRGKCREQAKEIRQLRKQLRYYQKQEHIFDGQDEDIAIDTEDTYPAIKPKELCNECGKGSYDEFEIMNKVYGTCNVCGHRKRIK